MEFMKKLIELNNLKQLDTISKELYEIDSDDDEEEITFINELKKEFITLNTKKNNRQFKIIKIN
tara:strand:- start:1709 stop:1900 length:192 start_codon:yes stop_codon:yes gene_type:complete